MPASSGWAKRLRAAGTFLYVATETLPVGLLEPIGQDLGVSDSRTGLLVSYYGLVVIVASIPLTHLTRRVGRRRLLSVLFLVFVVSSPASAAAGSYALLPATRVVTALSQALFWSIVVPAAAGLFPEAVRGRVVALVVGGGTLASVAGVSLGTWAAQHISWRGVFAGLAALGLLAAAALLASLPSAEQEEKTPEHGSSPDARRFWSIILMTVLATTGTFVFFTYVSRFLTETSTLPAGLLGVVLLGRGLGGLLAVAAAGPPVEHQPRLALALPLAIQVVAFFTLFWVSGSGVVVFAMITLTGFATR